jgi:type II secretory pathway predicted ATPase ExeA
VKRLIAKIDPNKVIAAHVVTTLLSGHDLLRMVAAALGLRDLPPDKSGVLLRLQSFFETTHSQGRRALLIVDEAQNLSESALEELRMLSNIQIGNSAPFQSFLVGQPQFRRLIASADLEQLRQRVIASYHLGPLGIAECGDYLMHRLRQVGWKDDPVFEPSAIEALHRQTGGIPRRINTLGNRLMMLGFLDELHRITRDDVNRVAADLANEMNGADESEINIADLPLNKGAILHSSLTSRLSGIEERLAQQETFMRRAGAFIQDFFNMRGTGVS